LNSPLGPILAIADELSLFFMEFIDLTGLERDLERLGERTKAAIIPGHTPVIDSIQSELELYFKGQLRQFKTPLFLVGTPFQKRVWMNLKSIPYGETRSYGDIATITGNPSACRAVARANGTSQLTIVIPCHRIINANGNLGGYGRGLSRKEWLLNHETIGFLTPI
jgi:AraC family transcriptional regulator of adaptative response/methylated-DNA-[protein]-cysteine methyltransferase